MTWVRNEDKWIKVLINLDYNIGKKYPLCTNHIVTSGISQNENIDGAGMIGRKREFFVQFKEDEKFNL
ncbi:MAG: hypothetical protein RBR08_07070 [Desulforegulaceae bacterium]|nr:hypothetical protein [Desulforegulaceae bacterium]